uniref:Uncharacterized protein n=1 Tax=viral metagenome TaxID=1070528 RepID=A0A6M3L1N1_9ZZZZ
MAAIIEKMQRDLGRFGEATLRASWQVGQLGDMDNEILVDIDEVTRTMENKALAVESIEWTKGLNMEVRIEFDSTPPKPESTILALPGGELNGSTNFTDSLNGCWPDPNRPTGGNIVVNTTGALQSDELWIRLNFRVKGTHAPG